VGDTSVSDARLEPSVPRTPVSVGAPRSRDDEEGLIINKVGFLGGYPCRTQKIGQPDLAIFPTSIALYDPRSGPEPVLEIGAWQISRIAISNTRDSVLLGVETSEGKAIFEVHSLSADELRRELETFKALSLRLDEGTATAQATTRPVPQTFARPVRDVVTYNPSVNIPAVLSTVGGAVSLGALPLQAASGPSGGLAPLTPWLWFFGAVAAVVLGFVARSQINSTGQPGRGYMIAGLTLGFVSFGLAILLLLAGLAALSILAR
jgi:hypothetical protein